MNSFKDILKMSQIILFNSLSLNIYFIDNMAVDKVTLISNLNRSKLDQLRQQTFDQLLRYLE